MAQRWFGGRAPKGIEVLLEETWRTYRASFKPVVLTAGAVALLASSLSRILPPSDNLVGFIWALALASLIVSSQVVVIPLVVLQRRHKPINSDVAVAAVLLYAPRYYAASFALTLVIAALVFSVVGIPIAILLIVRLVLLAPAIVVEDLSIPNALRRSWGLVQTRWWRTFGVYLVAVLIASGPIALAAIINALAQNGILGMALSTVSSAVSIPFTATFTLILYEDYRVLEMQSEDDDIFGPRPRLL